ncbi:hypothetical protein [Burkholderia sp. F1]|uniref:hypothetical protein n=1 Tax=Burkholderia sp. F1 TaxID=3366817 RepID=UPI003D72DBF5
MTRYWRWFAVDILRDVGVWNLAILPAKRQEDTTTIRAAIVGGSDEQSTRCGSVSGNPNATGARAIERDAARPD